MDAIATVILVMAFTIYTQIEGMEITCPTLVCRGDNFDEEHLQDNICFQHDGGNPTLELIGDSCLYH